MLGRAACIALALIGCGLTASAQTSETPNFVVVLVDDAALMDFGAYGGEARTPNIDALATRGALFTHYRSSPLCSPSRAMLLTGLDNHRTGIATIPEVLPPEQVGQPGYTMALEPGVMTLADRLRSNGYRTLMTGKWHMGSGKGELPDAHGFDRSFALDASGADNWEDKSYMPFYSDAPWYEDGKAAKLPKDFYSSQFIVDKMIDYLGETDADKPFLAYLAFQAIHIPVQAPPEFTAHYEGVYDEGWHALREARHATAMRRGLIPQGVALAPMPPGSRDWSSLTDEDRELYVARMQVNAGMMEAMDHHFGRLIAHLKQTGDYDNTVFVVASDNGPEPNRGDHDPRLGFWMRMNGYHVGMDGMGEQGSWGFIGPEWANAAASPGDLYKFYASEGGVRVPMIMAGPGIAPQTVPSAAMVTDIAPTLMELTHQTVYFKEDRPMTGRSLLPVLTGQAQRTYDTDEAFAIEVSGNTALYKGDYKITRAMPPMGDANWRLFDLAADPGETTDLSEARPGVMKDLLAEYAAYTEEMGVLDMPDGYDSTAIIETNVKARLSRQYGPKLIAMALGLAAILFFAVRWILRRRRARRA